MSFFGRSPAFFGGSFETAVITSDTDVGNLWNYFGNPVGPKNFTVIVDGADAADINITVDFDASSTFQITCINGGRLLGKGGDGGDGADDNGGTGGLADKGSNGGHAVTCSAPFTINVNIDDGYMFGGGGGGGGGGFEDDGTTGDPGGGGGGGQGFGTSAGGAAGTPSGFPIANPGSAGSVLAPGTGGAGGGANGGGAGGTWGEAGGVGGSDLVITSSIGAGGCGGDAGSAFRPSGGASINFNGVQGESNLRTQGRLIGEIFGKVSFQSGGVGPGVKTIFLSQVGLPIDPETCGWRFETDGDLVVTGSGFGTGPISGAWYSGSGFTSTDYDVRDRTDLRLGAAWTTEPAGTPGDWRDINVNRLWERTANPPWNIIQLFEIRRTSTTKVLARGWIDIEAAWEP